MDIGNFDKTLERMPSSRSKADAIASHLAKSIKLNHDDDPLFYENFSKRIKDALEDFRNKVLSEIEYLKKMKEILTDFRKGDTKVQYPPKIKGDLDAQAFYGVILPLITDVVPDTDLVADIALEITSIIKDHDQVDWKSNNDIHNSIKQNIDDLFYDIEQDKGIKVDFDTIDKVSDSVINIALRRF
jgi:type I restriction enzyme R subunit